MLQRWLLREPSLSFGLPVYVCAAILFPLHIGWTGAPLIEFAAYLAIAATLFALADGLVNADAYRKWTELVPQAVLSLLALAVPALLAFSIGSTIGPVDEALDEEACASQGVAEIDTIAADADDTFDVTPDCAAARAE